MGLPLEEKIDEGVGSEGEQKGRPREDTAAAVEGEGVPPGMVHPSPALLKINHSGRPKAL